MNKQYKIKKDIREFKESGGASRSIQLTLDNNDSKIYSTL